MIRPPVGHSSALARSEARDPLVTNHLPVSEFRQNPITREWILFSPERSRRPGRPERPPRSPPPPRPGHDPECPLCPGQELACTPGETLRYLDSSGEWTVRSFPNKFPAVRPQELADRTGDLLERRMPAAGHHEVICESRRHNATLATMRPAEVEAVVRAWYERIQALRLFKLTDYVSLFKNHGSRRPATTTTTGAVSGATCCTKSASGACAWWASAPGSPPSCPMQPTAPVRCGSSPTPTRAVSAWPNPSNCRRWPHSCTRCSIAWNARSAIPPSTWCSGSAAGGIFGLSTATGIWPSCPG
ncbi:hypothetical protein DYH09_30590 [bacterium CPR1]|nr:hypothetical protein [bacterium CPR1]